MLFRSGLGLIANILGPGISWSCPRASSLNSEVIDASNEPEVSSFSPVAAPRVTNNPVLDSILLSPSIDADIVILGKSSGVVFEDAASIVE